MEATEEQIASAIARLEWDDWNVMANLRLTQQMAAIGPKAIPQLRQALKSDIPNVRAGAAEALGQFPSNRTMSMPLAALNDPDAGIRSKAVYELAESGSHEAAVALAQAWETEQDQRVHRAIIFAIIFESEQLRSPEIEQVLLSAMHDPDFEIARESAKILAKWGSPQAAFGMLGIVLRATEAEWESYDFAEEAIFVLGKGDSSVVPACIEALNNSSEYVRGAVASALGENGDPKAVPALIRLLDDPDEDVRFHSILSLGRIGTPEALAVLLPLLRNDTLETEWALKAVHNIMDTEVIAACANCLLHSEYRILFPAADALATQGQSGMAALIAALQSPIATTRIAATEGLKFTKDRIATEPLIRALNDENERVRSTAAWGLGSISDPLAADALLDALDDQAAQSQAAVALGKLGDHRAVPKICALMKSDDFEKRRSAVRALHNLADPSSYDALLAVCMDEYDIDEYDDVQEKAAMVLGWLNLPEAADTLVSMLRYEKSELARRGAAYALGALGLEWTRTELTRAWWEDENINVFYAAHAALERFGDRSLCSPKN